MLNAQLQQEWMQIWYAATDKERRELLSRMKLVYNADSEANIPTTPRKETHMSIDLIAILLALGGLILFYVSKKQAAWLAVSGLGAGMFGILWWLLDPIFLVSQFTLWQIIGLVLLAGSILLYYLSGREGNLWYWLGGFGAGMLIAMWWAETYFILP